eukprot:9424685-Pyramimonas_sp.AAC.1
MQVNDCSNEILAELFVRTIRLAKTVHEPHEGHALPAAAVRSKLANLLDVTLSAEMQTPECPAWRRRARPLAAHITNQNNV